MKRHYQAPKMKIVKLKHRATLLEASVLYHGVVAFDNPAEPLDTAKG